MGQYGEVLKTIDVFWTVAFIVGALVFCYIVTFKWVRQDVLLGFLLYKIAIGAGFSTWAIITNQDFDSAGAFVSGQPYAELFRDLLRRESIAFLQETPFFGYSGISTDRLSSLTGLVLAINGNSFIGTVLCIGLLGSIGQLLIYRYLRDTFPRIRPRYWLPLLFHPSLCLWSGMLTKDAIGIFALGLLIYHADKFVVRPKLTNLLGILIGVQFAIGFRSFILVMFFIFVLFSIWENKFQHSKTSNLGLKLMYLYCALVISVVALIYYVSNFGRDMVEIQQATNVGYSQLEGGSTFDNVELSYSLRGVLALPIGAINALFRPFIWEVTKVNQFLASFENLCVLGFVMRGWYVYMYKIESQERREIRAVFWGFAIMTLVCASGVGLFTSNLGSISRYRIPLIPLFIAGPALALGIDARNRGRPTFGFHALPASVART